MNYATKHNRSLTYQYKKKTCQIHLNYEYNLNNENQPNTIVKKRVNRNIYNGKKIRTLEG